MMKYIIKHLILLLIIFPGLLNSQNHIIDTNEEETYPNVIKNMVFVSRGQYYPLSVSLSPFGFWYFCKIRTGFSNFQDFETLKAVSFGWSKDSVEWSTPSTYFYDTLRIDTLYSIFDKVLCKTNTKGVDKDFDKRNEDLDELIAAEIKYSYLFETLEKRSTSSEMIRVTYPTIAYPFKSLYAIILFEIWPDSISIHSYSINTSNIFDMKVIDNGRILMKEKDFRRFTKRVNKTIFDTQIDCQICFTEIFSDFDVVIEKLTDDTHDVFFLCALMREFVNNRDEKLIIDYLLGLYHSSYHINKKYFGIERQTYYPN